MPSNVPSVNMSDPDFIKQAITAGNWERYEHPQKGETYTLMAGNTAVLSIHEILLGGEWPKTRFVNMMIDSDMHLTYFLLAENAKLRQQMDAMVEVLMEMKDQMNAAQERSIEARNPGIDMDEVRRIRRRQ